MAYPAQTWSRLKTAYESGKYKSVDEMMSEWEKKGKKLPTPHAVEKRAVKDGWKKAELAPVIEKAIQNKMIEKFAEAGVKDIGLEVCGTVRDMLKATRPTIVKGYGEEKERAVDGDPDAPQGFVAEVEDWQARDKAVTQASKLCGLYAAEKGEINHIFPTGLKMRIATLDD